MLVATQGRPQLILTARAGIGAHGCVQLDHNSHQPTGLTTPRIKIRHAVEGLAAIVELLIESIQGRLGKPGGTSIAATEVPINGLDDRLHAPTRLLLLVAIRRDMTQGAADGLSVKLQHVSRAERGNQFHV
ncbi:hypothetical protein AS156_30265 [Bradyrhizobium macuxiense]|uniref:Uncharacterized protein n=1 Tax=Bradyrhizobium macuxiense TaxID=1755647 RepID=A0A125QA97_9BRAD|nr:hypothetical protein AS156_30265 [Bradyrhizobium macuxiense]